jgi:ribA/ribD-fused uncharacterized protein
MTTIDSFTGDYTFLSNFYPAPVTFDGLLYPTTEHAFQAAKTLNYMERREIQSLAKPGDAKRRGRTVTLRDNWEVLKNHVMFGLLRDKFSKGHLRDKLLATGDAKLIEGNTWGDTYWGVCNGHGQNHLGTLLMAVRDELRTGEIAL